MHALATYHREPNPVPTWAWWLLGGAVVVGGGVVFARSVAAKRPKNCPPKLLPVQYDWNRSPDHPGALSKQQLRAMKAGDAATGIISPSLWDLEGQPVPGQDMKYPSYTVPVKLFRYDEPDRLPPHGKINFETDCEMEILVPGGDNWVFVGVGAIGSIVDKDPAWMQGYLFDPAVVPPGKQFYLQPS